MLSQDNDAMMIDSQLVPDRTSTVYPAPFKPLVAGRTKKRLGEAAGLKNFGVNQVTLHPGSCSSLRHWHSLQDEFIYVLEGELTLITNQGAQRLTAGMMAGFPAGEADGHHLVNRSNAIAVFLEVGDRTPHDRVTYPDDDLMATEKSGTWMITHKDGSPYEA